MPPKTTLDQKLLAKMSAHLDKNPDYVRQQISKRANRLHVTSQASQVIWASQLGIATGRALKGLEAHVQQQVKAALGGAPSEGRGLQAQPTSVASDTHRQQDPLTVASDALLIDPELRSRCSDLLRRKKHLDRALREATTILENRIRQLAGITSSMKPEELVNTALNPDPTKAMLLYGSSPSEQQGLHSICRGIVLAIRHPTHHKLTEATTRESALQFCAFIDLLLQTLATTNRRSP